MEIALRGIGVSPGIAIGPALPFKVQSLEIPRYSVEDKEAELARFRQALESVREDIRRIQEQTRQGLGRLHADIFKAHLMLLEDVAFHEEIENRFRAEGLNVECIIDDLVKRYTKAIESVDDARFRERTQDILDVSTRILSKLLKTELGSLEHIERPSIVVAHDLPPSDMAKIDLVNTLGIATDVSGPTSHTAILARAFEIPAVVGLRHVGTHVLADDLMILDGGEGYVYIRPGPATLTRFLTEKKRLEGEREALLQTEADQPSVTLDGHSVPTLANIELPVEIAHSLKARAQGVGLYRTEYLFLNRTSLPTEDEQFEAYAQAADAFNPQPVILRTLDLGGDKLVSHLQLAPEINPQLGWRAIRFCLERPDIFKAQLRAMLRSSVHGNVQIMFPLISGVDELRRVKDVVREVCADLERRSISFDPDIKLGSMIEVPSAVMVADMLARECDFFSIGTNDLIQYSLAVDRVNEKIAYMYEPAHPAVIRMIMQTIRAAKAARIPCSICGEMAGDPVFTELLVGLGVDSLSMSPVAIPLVRAEIAGSRLSVAKRLARRVLGLSCLADVKGVLTSRSRERQGVE